jgi:uncharacterized membrane protein (DUF106 family)
MDRLEKLMDLLITDHLSFTDEHKRLLTAQVVLTETVQQLAEAQKRTEEAQKRTEETLKELAEGQSVLMRMMDEWIRNRPNA